VKSESNTSEGILYKDHAVARIDVNLAELSDGMVITQESFRNCKATPSCSVEKTEESHEEGEPINVDRLVNGDLSQKNILWFRNSPLGHPFTLKLKTSVSGSKLILAHNFDFQINKKVREVADFSLSGETILAANKEYLLDESTLLSQIKISKFNYDEYEKVSVYLKCRLAKTK
jgi:hypothetical protein